MEIQIGKWHDLTNPWNKKLLLEWLQPLKSSCAMVDRKTTGTNKTYQTGLQKVFKFVLKRKDVELSR